LFISSSLKYPRAARVLQMIFPPPLGGGGGGGGGGGF